MAQSVSELLASRKALINLKDKAADELSKIGGQIEDVDRALMGAMKDLGMTKDGAKVSEHGLTATMRTKWRAKYEPDQWPAIFKWAAESGRDYLIHRRLSDAKVMELVDEGVSLPDGLTTEAYPSLDFRRS